MGPHPVPADDGDVRLALAAARAAAAAIEPFTCGTGACDPTAKADGSPVTAADLAASAAAIAALRAGAPGDVLVTEEAPPPEGWRQARRVWFVDPIDGTREFVARIPEWCVMIGLVEAGRPKVGVVLDPNVGTTHVGLVGAGAWSIDRGGAWRAVRPAPRTELRGAHDVRSRFHEPDEVTRWAAWAGVGPRTPCGSMGLKAVRIVEGRADFHLRPTGHCWYWDSAGPAALMMAAGASIEAADGPLRFDEPSLKHQGIALCAPGLLPAIRASWAAWRAGPGRPT